MQAMKISAMAVVVVACIGLQGCAGTGGTRPASNLHATGADTAVTPAAAPGDSKAIVKADTKENFEAVVAAVHKQMAAGGRWQFVSTSERATIDGNFADMQKLYDQYGSVDKMSSDAKIRLLADQSSVNAILTRKDGDRLICQSEVPVGSHLPIKTCKTYAQIQMEQRGAQQMLRNLGANSPQLNEGKPGGH